MPTPVRLASFNCENLFSRPRIFSVSDARSQTLLTKVAELETELSRPSFDHERIKQLKEDLRDFVIVNDIRGKHMSASGAGTWVGWIEFVRRPLTKGAVENTAHVLADLDADVLCLVEIEDRFGLQHFHDDVLVKQFLAPAQRNGYEHVLLIDGNDERGIDVAVLARREVGWLRSHVHEWTDYTPQNLPTKRVRQFSRDCLEVRINLPGNLPLFLLINHLKSQIDSEGDPDSTIRRRDQAERVREIADTYDLANDYVAVVGDLNSANGDHSLDALLTHPALTDLVQDLPAGEHWTYQGQQRQQLDYILASTALAALPRQVRIERRGLFTPGCAAAGTCYPEVKSSQASASDHAGIVVEFQLPT